jgi:hypothetical protein
MRYGDENGRQRGRWLELRYCDELRMEVGYEVR